MLVILLEPSGDSYLTTVYIYPLNFSDVFEPSRFNYSMEISVLVESVVVEPVPARFAEVEISLVDSGDGSSHVDTSGTFANETLRQNSRRLFFNGNDLHVEISVLAQNGSSTQYTVFLNQTDPQSCEEQRHCEVFSSTIKHCGDICPEDVRMNTNAESFGIGWQVTLSIAGVCAGT